MSVSKPSADLLFVSSSFQLTKQSVYQEKVTVHSPVWNSLEHISLWKLVDLVTAVLFLSGYFFMMFQDFVLSSQAFLCKPRVVYPCYYCKARKALWPLFSGHFSFHSVRNRINPFNLYTPANSLGCQSIWVYLHQSFQRREIDRHGGDMEQSFKALTPRLL